MAAPGLTSYRLNNNLKSTALLLLFPLLLLTLLGGIFFAFGAIGRSREVFDLFGLQSVLDTGSPSDLALSAMYAWWPIVLGLAAVWVLIGYFFNDWIIHRATGAKPVVRAEHPDLYNVLENLCISRGMTMPKLYIVDADALNAYASGIDDKSYAVTVTSGLLQRLDRNELEAVLAHELTHILERDTRLLIVTVVFVGMISFLAQLLWRSMRIASFRRVRGRAGGAVVILMLISAVALAIGYLLALLLRFAISRRREYQADAGSVDITKNPDALISALLKIADNPDVPNVPTEVRQMFIENPRNAFAGLFATHPPIGKRITVLQQLGGHVPAAPDRGSLAPPFAAGASSSPWA